MKNIDLGKRLALGFGVIAIGSGIVGGLNVLTLEQIQKNVVEVRDEDIVKLELAMRLQGAVEEQAALVLRHVLSKEKDDKAQVEQAMREQSEDRPVLRGLLRPRAEGPRRTRRLRPGQGPEDSSHWGAYETARDQPHQRPREGHGAL